MIQQQCCFNAKDPRAQGITKWIKHTQPGGDLFDETFKGVCNRLHQPTGGTITVNNLLMGAEMPGTSSLSSVPWADACPFIPNAPAVGCRRECRAASNKNNPIWGSGTCSLSSKDTMSFDIPRNWTIIEYLTNTHRQEYFHMDSVK